MNKNELLFYLILFLMFIGGISPIFTYASVILSALVAIIIGINSTKKNSWHICKMIIVLLIFQNLMIGMGAHIFENTSDSLKYLTQIPFLTTIIIWGCHFLNNIKVQFKLEKTQKNFIILIFCILISFIFGRGNINSILLNIRNMTFFFFVYEIGKISIKSKEDLYKLIKFTIHMAGVLLIFGIILLYGGYDLYNRIGINEVYIAKGSKYLGRLDGRFTTILISKQVYRMGSILYEPVNLAYFYAFTFLACIYSNWTKKNNKIFWSMICITGLLLTFGKGGYMIVLAAFLFINVERFFNRIKINNMSKKRKYKLTAILVILFLIFIASAYYLKIGAAAKQHYWGIIRTWNSIIERPYGYGIGTGGNAAKTFASDNFNSNWLSAGGETAIMSFIYQIGIQGIIPFILCLISTGNKKIQNKDDKLFVLSFYIPFILIGIGLLQDNTFTPQCISLIMMIQGAISNIKESGDEIT